MSIPGFDDGVAQLNGQSIAYSIGGKGPPVLLLHGFPQTRAMWMHVAPRLSKSFTVVASDLRGYGDSSKPTTVKDMGFRPMAQDQRALMANLGFDRFHIVGHDRGGRTAHRLALDSPDAVISATVMDIVPTHVLLDRLTREVALAYYHWFFLAQPAPMPETLIAPDPDAYFEGCLAGWGGARLDDFPAEALEAYRQSWRRPETIAAMCHDYRAGASLDFKLDAQDLARRVCCPAMVMFGRDGAMAKHFDIAETWSQRFTDLRAVGCPGGHFFVDAFPNETADALSAFLSDIG